MILVECNLKERHRHAYVHRYWVLNGTSEMIDVFRESLRHDESDDHDTNVANFHSSSEQTTSGSSVLWSRTFFLSAVSSTKPTDPSIINACLTIERTARITKEKKRTLPHPLIPAETQSSFRTSVAWQINEVASVRRREPTNENANQQILSSDVENSVSSVVWREGASWIYSYHKIVRVQEETIVAADTRFLGY